MKLGAGESRSEHWRGIIFIEHDSFVNIAHMGFDGESES